MSEWEVGRESKKMKSNVENSEYAEKANQEEDEK